MNLHSLQIRIIKWIIIWVCITNPIYSFAYFIKKINFESGLSNNSTYTAVKDGWGNIFIGTDYGLNIFQGQNGIRYILKNQGLGSNFIVELCKLPNKNIIIVSAYGQGLFLYNNNHIEPLTLIHNGLTIKNINSIYAESDNQLWLFDSYRGYFHIDIEKNINKIELIIPEWHDENYQLVKKRIFFTLGNQRGMINEQGIWWYENNKLIPDPTYKGIIKSYSYDEKNNLLHYIENDKLYTIDSTRKIISSIHNNYFRNTSHFVKSDNGWILSQYDNSIIHLTEGNIENLVTPNQGIFINALYKDENLIYLLTSNDGLYLLYPGIRDISSDVIKKTMSSNMRFTSSNYDKKLWLTGYDFKNKLVFYENNRINHIEIQLNLAAQTLPVLDVKENDSLLYIFIGSNLYIYNKSNRSTITFQGINRSKRTFVDENNNISFFGCDGQYIVHEDTISRISIDSLDCQKKYYDVVQFSNYIFAIANDGFYVYTSKEKKRKIDGDIPNDLYVHDEKLWIVYDNYVTAYNKFGTQTGVYNNQMSHINKRIYWDDKSYKLITNRGFSIIHTDMNIISEYSFEEWDIGEVYDIEFRETYFIISTTKGVYSVDINLIINKPIFENQILTFEFGNDSIVILNNQISLKGTYSHSAITIFKPGSYDFTTGKYIIKRSRKDSIDYIPVNQGKINLGKLIPGEINFEIYYYDITNNKFIVTKSFTIYISPSFTQTIWFKLIIILTILLIILLIGLIIRTAQHEKIRKKSLIEHKVFVLEQESLKSLMNPHFVFNALNTIQYFVNNEEADNASMYLSKLGKLLRMYLDANFSRRIALSDEIELIRLYVDLEMLRFSGNLTYTVDISGVQCLEDINIPPFFIQPIIENAIHHGIMQTGAGKIILKISETNNLHDISIEVFNTGSSYNPAYKNTEDKNSIKRKSLSSQIIKKRLHFLSLIYKRHFDYSISATNNFNHLSGTLVSITLPNIPFDN